MSLEHRIIPCHFTNVEGEKRMQLECSAVERLDCFELFVTPDGRVTNMPWPGKTLRLPKSLFHALSDEGETSGLQLLMPLGADSICFPKSLSSRRPLRQIAAQSTTFPDQSASQVAFAGTCLA